MTTHEKTHTHPELTIVVPTYNERENIRPLVKLLDTAISDLDWEVVFVDDDSPDGTADEVRSLAQERFEVRIIHRVGRRGLAGSCIEGIQSSTASIVAVMDGDLQHDETKLADMFALFKENPALDLVIGSRKVEGGSSDGGLSAVRQWGSNIATELARKLLRIKVSDPMSGFFMVKRESFNSQVLNLQQQGFKILADLLSATKGSWNVREVGYEFRDRQFGQSKMDAAVTLEFLGLLAVRLTGGLVSIRFVLFMLVGFSGLFVHLTFLWAMLRLFQDQFAFSQTVAVAVAMTTNFTLNNILTYKDRSLKGMKFFTGLLSFYGVCSVGAVANIGVATAIFVVFPFWAIAGFCGALIGALWNFVASSHVTWRD